MTHSTHAPAAPSSPPVTETRDPSAMDELRHAIDAVGVLVSNLWPRVSREDATAVRQAWDRVYTTWAAALNPTVTPGTQPPQLDALYAKGRVIVDSVFGPPRVPGPFEAAITALEDTCLSDSAGVAVLLTLDEFNGLASTPAGAGETPQKESFDASAETDRCRTIAFAVNDGPLNVQPVSVNQVRHVLRCAARLDAESAPIPEGTADA